MTQMSMVAQENTALLVDDLNLLAEKLKTYAGDENDLILQDVAEQLNKRPSLIARLFPSPIEKERNRLTVQHLRLLYQDREKFFKFYSDVKLEVAKKYATAFVASVGMGLQTKLAKFAHAQIDELSETIALNRQRFMSRMAPQLQELETYSQFPELAEPARISMKNEIAIYFATVNALLQGFIDSLKGQAACV